MGVKALGIVGNDSGSFVFLTKEPLAEVLLAVGTNELGFVGSTELTGVVVLLKHFLFAPVAGLDGNAEVGDMFKDWPKLVLPNHLLLGCFKVKKYLQAPLFLFTVVKGCILLLLLFLSSFPIQEFPNCPVQLITNWDSFISQHLSLLFRGKGVLPFLWLLLLVFNGPDEAVPGSILVVFFADSTVDKPTRVNGFTLVLPEVRDVKGSVAVFAALDSLAGGVLPGRGHLPILSLQGPMSVIAVPGAEASVAILTVDPFFDLALLGVEAGGAACSALCVSVLVIETPVALVTPVCSIEKDMRLKMR